MHFQAFKLVVTDPDSVLNGLTREIKETGPDGQEVLETAYQPFGWLRMIKNICGCEFSGH
jgi:hypothetical protein